MEQNNPTLLRSAVHAFMANSRHETVQEYKRRYTEVLAAWREYWNVMLRNYEWVDYIFIQSTAWFLCRDIIIVTTSSTEDHPYITISGNLADERVPCQGIPLIIGTKSNVHYQSLLPIEVRVSRKMVPSSPENTIEMELKAAMASSQNEHPDLASREQFPDLKPSNGKRHDQPGASTSKKEIPKSKKHDQQRTPASGKDMDNLNHNQNKHEEKNENPQGPEQPNKKKAFQYMQGGKLLNFQFVSEKRVKCPKCQRDYKNILLHLQKSSCSVSDPADLGEKLHQYTKVNLEQEIKDDQRKLKQKSTMKQREVNNQQVLDDQNKRKAKSTMKQRDLDNQQVLDDQNKRKAKSKLKHQKKDNQQVLGEQNKRKSRSRLEKRQVDHQKVLDDQNNWKTKSRLDQIKVDKQKVLEDQNNWKANSTLKQREVDNQKVLDGQNKRKAKSMSNQRRVDNQKVLNDQNKRKKLSRTKRKLADPIGLSAYENEAEERREGYGRQKID
jgi:hypothetical protein